MGSGESMKVGDSVPLYHNPFANINQVDYILFIKADVDLDINKNEVQDHKYVSKEQLNTMFENKELKFTPWFKLICTTMLFEWWDHLNDGLEKYTNEQDIRRML